MIPKEMSKGTWLQGENRLGQNRESEYLGAEDIYPDNAEPIVTIKALWNGKITLQGGRKENHDVLVFAEETVPGINQMRPLIVNSTNRKALRKLFGGVTANILTGKQIQLYIDHNVRSPEGGVTDGIRVRPYKPRPQQSRRSAPVCADCGKLITPVQDGTVEQIVAYTQQHYGVCLCADCDVKRRPASQQLSEPPTDRSGDTAAPQEAAQDCKEVLL